MHVEILFLKHQTTVMNFEKGNHDMGNPVVSGHGNHVVNMQFF